MRFKCDLIYNTYLFNSASVVIALKFTQVLTNALMRSLGANVTPHLILLVVLLETLLDIFANDFPRLDQSAQINLEVNFLMILDFYLE